jgi:predicted RNase H-like nuclease (RuvC/YqgF family)
MTESKKEKDERKAENGSAKTKRNNRPYQTRYSGKSMTKQSFRKECDMLSIVQRYYHTGEVPESRPSLSGYPGGDFFELQLQMAQARSAFETLRLDLREKYGSVEGLLEAYETIEGLRELDADGIIQLKEPLTTTNEENAVTDDLKASQEVEAPSPADPGEAGITT